MKWLLLVVFVLMSVSPVLAQTQMFNNPRVNGYAVDRCLYSGQQCNQPAADEFCRRNGFQRARRFAWDFMAPTLILATGQICKVPGRGGCGGFTFIECQARGQGGGGFGHGERTFNNPRMNGYAVDRCLYYGQQCNQPAADEFCRRNGFQRARNFAWAFMAPTRILATGQICNVPGRGGCGGFTRITCVGGRGGGPNPPPRGGKGPGDPCQTREECRSGICLLGVCN